MNSFSWRIPPQIWGLVVLALLLRLGAALLTYYVIIPLKLFPDYYFSDMWEYHYGAEALLQKGLFELLPPYSGSKLWYMRLSAVFYSLFATSPLTMMMVNGILSTLLVFPIFWLARLVFHSDAPGVLAVAIYTGYPSLIFYGSAHMRDPWIIFFFITAFLLFLLYVNSTSWKESFLFLFSFLFIFGVAVKLRPHIVLFLSVGVLLGGGILLFLRQWRLSIRIALAFLCVFTVGHLMNKLLSRLEPPPPPPSPSRVVTAEEKKAGKRLLLIDPIARFRKNFLLSHLTSDHPPKTLLFPHWYPKSYGDFVLMELKLIGYLLFMPLPGLYPIDGRIARLFMAVENVFFLLFFLCALWGIWLSFKKPESRNSSILLIGYLIAFIGIWAFFCPDLGSASRYRLSYAPLIFLFTSFGISQIWQRRFATSTS